MRDQKHYLSIGISVAPGVLKTTTATGTGIDLQGYEEATAAVQFGAITDGTFTPSLEESDTLGSGYTAVAAGDLLGSFSAAATGGGASAVQTVGYIGKKRYIRVVLTVTGSPATGGYAQANILRTRPRHMGGAAV